jgi:flavin-dependent dehydrogenase
MATAVRNAPREVVIMGGGLAGLTLALQLKRQHPGIDVLVLERRAHPVPHATHKVGESSVEIGAHYFDKVIGLGEHLRGTQLRKFGFRFFFSEGRRDIDQVLEIGASRSLTVPSYQIDRGIFENHLGDQARQAGVDFVDGAVIDRIDLAPDPDAPGAMHHLAWRNAAGQRFEAQARWLVDACGRAGMLKRKLGLAEHNTHQANAVWFRMADRIHVDEWSSDPAWQARCDPPARWRSTNHLVGEGYWVWLIPLASGSHSIGIVADPARHPLEDFNTFDKAMAWLQRYQPRLYDELDGRRGKLQDFAFFRKFSYGCKQVFSAQRWALTGDAGLFLDPFYSPGSDFIAIGNTYIADLIGRDRAGERFDLRAGVYDQIFHSFYDSTLALYQDQYGIFGDPEALPMKVIWDYTYYWGVLAQIFFHQRLTDITLLGSLRAHFIHGQRLNAAMQDLLRAWSAVSAREVRPGMLDHAALPWFAELNRSLTDQLDDHAFRQRIVGSVGQMRQLAGEIVQQALALHGALDVSALRALLRDDIDVEIDADADTDTDMPAAEAMLFGAALQPA